jgi:hypothetical protein
MSRPSRPTLSERLTRIALDVLEARLAAELCRLRSRLAADEEVAATRGVPRGPSRRSAPRRAATGGRVPAPATSAAPARPALALAATVAERLQKSGVRDVSLVEGSIRAPGSPAPAPHAWVEAGDRVHDPTQGEFRRVWPRELYYHVFQATRRAA